MGLLLLGPLLTIAGATGDLPSAAALGDEAFARIDYPAAVVCYTEGLNDHPASAELLWRLARANVCMAEVEEGEARARHLAEAERCARECIARDSTRGEGHTWLAGALGYQALGVGTARKLELSRELLREARRALDLNPEDDAAWSILGSFYRALGNVGWLEKALASLLVGEVPGGGYAEAEIALRKAVSIAPGVMRHRYELGILLMDSGRREEARRTLEEAAALPVRTAIDRPRLERIRELLSGPELR